MDLVYIKNDPDYKKKRYQVYDCPYNNGCHCDKMDCYRCGWNPKVEEARNKKLGIKKEGKD